MASDKKSAFDAYDAYDDLAPTENKPAEKKVDNPWDAPGRFVSEPEAPRRTVEKEPKAVAESRSDLKLAEDGINNDLEPDLDALLPSGDSVRLV